jgi:hypothetical protein
MTAQIQFSVPLISVDGSGYQLLAAVVIELCVVTVASLDTSLFLVVRNLVVEIIFILLTWDGRSSGA